MTTKTSSFVHLKIHTEYSIIDGMLRIDDVVTNAKADGMSAIAISDNSNLFALVKFYRKAIAAGIKPIIATDVWLHEEGEKYRLTLYCQNKKGYHNLTQLISRAYTEGQIDSVPTIRWSWLEQWNEGLLVLSGAQEGDVGCAVSANNFLLAEKRLERWIQLFPNRYYLELQRIGHQGEEDYIRRSIQLATQYNLPIVATNNVCFLSHDDFEAHEARVCIHAGYVLDDPKRPRKYRETQYFRSQQEMISLFSDLPEALENTIEIAKRCSVELLLGTPFLPNFPVPNGISLRAYLELKSTEGLLHYFSKTPAITEEKQKEYQERLKMELDVINSMGFPGYFLIVADFIGWAKQQSIPVGPGRGSGAGSLVAFCLDITELDPIFHDLLFERFLNPERVSMPDFDIDFCMDRRDEVIDYVAQRYGRMAVSQIITYGTMAAKAVVRDVGRVLGMPYGFVDKIAKLIPFELGITLKNALAAEDKLATRYHEEEDVKTLIDLALKLEGITRNAGKHAGGVVIAPTQLTDFTPLYCESDGKSVVTQFDKDDVEAVGLVKFDFLGLRTLTIIQWALISINKIRKEQSKELINIRTIPLDDEKTYELLRRCRTTAVFQLESRGMKELVRRLQPDTFDDITALVALFRPGPLQSGMVDDYIDRKHGRSTVHYSHPMLKPILHNTNGVILYQEQVMKIARVLAGYSLGGADLLRRAMGKKKQEEMARHRQIFIDGAKLQNISEDIAGHIFDLMEKFADYGFNKSHSAAYALISYQTAWLKAHYPSDFMAAVLSSDMDNTDKIVLFLNECTHLGLTVNAPNINRNNYRFEVNANAQQEIEYGLGAIKGVGEAAACSIIEERKARGSFNNLFDFCQRVDLRKVNKRVMEVLVLSGAMDCFSQSRSVLFATLKKAVKLAEQFQRDQVSGQADLFGVEEYSNTNTDTNTAYTYLISEAWSEAKRLQGEKDTLGYYLSGHPIQVYEAELEQWISAPIRGLDELLRKEVVVAGMVLDIRAMTTKNGRRMAIVGIEDRTGKIEITLFSKLYEEVTHFLQKGQIIIVRGKTEEDSYTGGVRIVAESLELIDKMRERLAKRLVIHIHSQEQVDRIINELPNLIESYREGSCSIAIAYRCESASAEIKLSDAWRVQPKEELISRLREWCGDKEVVLQY